MYFYLRGKEIAQEFGFPVIRPSFTLGGTERLLCIKEDFDTLTRGLEASPIHEVIDKALMGWKEYELNFER
jgi:carbamoylphosphate synthase large subunit